MRRPVGQYLRVLAGCVALVAVLETLGRLVDQGGNECALIEDRFAPCAMEMAGGRPDESRCDIALARGPRLLAPGGCGG